LHWLTEDAARSARLTAAAITAGQPAAGTRADAHGWPAAARRRLQDFAASGKQGAMSNGPPSSILRLAPALFVLLWSTGFIATKVAVGHTQPLTWLALRMTITVVLLLMIAAATRPVWPDRMQVWHSIVTGVLLQGVQLGGVTIALDHAVPSGLSALIPGLQPILTSLLAGPLLGERVTKLQWLGLLLGLAGVVLVLHDRPVTGQAGWGWIASAVSLVGITLGTLYQKRYGGAIDWRAGNVIQFAAAGLFCLVGAWLFEPMTIAWSPSFVATLGWSSLVLSVATVALLYWLIRRSGATEVASLFYLVPAVTAAMAYAMFGETLDALSIGGIVLCAIGVLVVHRARA
jgi:drug/metabolite transporter (DMT)-like permease